MFFGKRYLLRSHSVCTLTKQIGTLFENVLQAQRMVLQMLEINHGGNMFSGCPAAAVFIVTPINQTLC